MTKLNYMREINFRFYDGKKLIYFDLMDLYTSGQGVWSNLTFQCLENPQQFIGLKDKNGRDIYEGDIIEYEHDFGSGLEKTSDTIRYNYYGFYPFITGVGIDNETLEIIGNIYEKNNKIN